MNRNLQNWQRMKVMNWLMDVDQEQEVPTSPKAEASSSESASAAAASQPNPMESWETATVERHQPQAFGDDIDEPTRARYIELLNNMAEACIAAASALERVDPNNIDYTTWTVVGDANNAVTAVPAMFAEIIAEAGLDGRSTSLNPTTYIRAANAAVAAAASLRIRLLPQDLQQAGAGLGQEGPQN